ncbi:hypothetical protein BH23GEM8_BH23GEM8_18590 [soil metagenome]
MLLDPLDHAIGTRAKVRLLRALVPLDRPVSGREAARLAGVSRQAIRSLDELVAVGIVRRQETAGQHLYTFNGQNRLAPAIANLFDAERQRATELFERLAALVTGAGGVSSAVVFGSAARGEAGPGSDLDLLVLGNDRESEGAIYTALVEASAALELEFGVDLSPVVITVEQARHQKSEGDSFIAEVVRDGRRIFGRPLEEVLRG